MAHAQKPDLVFQRNGRVHLNSRVGGGQFSRLLATEVCSSAVVMVVMLDTPCSEVEYKTTGYPLHSHVSPSLPLLCFTVCHQVSTELYYSVYTAISICHGFMLTGCWQDRDERITYTNCCIYKVIPHNDEQQTCSKHVEVNY